ncbi:GPI mannosyltransferase 1 [Manduca sexta]|uniref:GPI mannosyltransferase 1 n=1 Tax=Manduca sexta TaxID=7130 RepID=UPI0011825AD2|nr:GPI mannosyltransferase 1 [Manduca sexta]
MHRLVQFIHLPFKWHLMAGVFIRLLLILYGNYHDKYYDVPYTDVDYKVFTDAARHVLNGNSPYKRHTYRYSPLVAYLMIPNILIGKEFGKLLFSAFDILVTVGVKVLVEYHLSKIKNASKIATYSSLIWLYNPLSIAISTRGNADSVACFFVIMSLLFLQTEVVKGLSKFVLAGVMLGVSIHLRLYPLVFSFPMYLSLCDCQYKRITSLGSFVCNLMPNKKQLLLTLSCVGTLYSLTHTMYTLYGYEFLFETYIYHLFRKDTRHNFSIMFYYSYLTMDQILAVDVVKLVMQVFEFIIILVLGMGFGCDPRTLPFAMFSQAVILVAFNSVITSQYFVWFLSLFPLVVHSFKMVRARAVYMALLWALGQGAWLFYAYLLEFKSREVFILIWLKSVVFFCANVFLLGQLVLCYQPDFGFGYNLVSRDIKNK